MVRERILGHSFACVPFMPPLTNFFCIQLLTSLLFLQVGVGCQDPERLSSVFELSVASSSSSPLGLASLLSRRSLPHSDSVSDGPVCR